MPEHTLVIGGARSGKSSLALRLAESDGGRLIFLATAQARDGEMTDRIQRHQAERGPAWTTLEETLELERVLSEADAPDAVILVDCLTMWISNLLTQAGLDEPAVEARCRDLAGLLPDLQGRVILVGNEVGMGIVPGNALSRSFRDLAGRLHQLLGRVCTHVILTAAGLPLTLKGGPLPDSAILGGDRT